MSYRNKILVLILFVLTVFVIGLPDVALAAEFPGIAWERTFGGTENDFGQQVRETSDGGYILVGGTASNHAGNPGIYVVKVDSNGNKQWEKTYPPGDYSLPSNIRQTADGGYVIVGTTPDTYHSICLIKTDILGNVQWTKYYNGGQADYGNDVEQASDGGYIIVGQTTSYGAGNGDVYLLKVSADGSKQWQKTFGGRYVDSGKAIKKTADGGYIIVGGTKSKGDYEGDIYLIKVDVDGNTQWERTYGTTNSEWGYDVSQTEDGGYVVLGNGPNYGMVIKTDSNGLAQWTKTYITSYGNSWNSIDTTSDGGYIITGVSYSNTTGYDLYLIKLDPNGNKLWDKILGGNASDGGSSIRKTTDGGYIVAGSTWSMGAGNADVYLVKIKPEVANPQLTSLSVEPVSLILEAGKNLELKVTAHYSDGSIKEVTNEAIYQVEDESIAKVVNGIVQGIKPGITNITISYQEKTINLPLTVNQPALVGISVNPTLLNLGRGESQQLSVTASFADGSTQNVTNKASYQSGDSTVANVNSTGLVIGVNPGSIGITVTYQDKSVTVPVTVKGSASELIGLMVNPNTLYLAKGQTQQLSVIASFSDGTTQNVTSLAGYESSDSNIVTVSTEGLVTSIDYGNAQITISYESKSIVIPVTIGQYTVITSARQVYQRPSVIQPQAREKVTPTVVTAPSRGQTTPTVSTPSKKESGAPSVTYPTASGRSGSNPAVVLAPDRKYSNNIPVVYPK